AGRPGPPVPSARRPVRYRRCIAAANTVRAPLDEIRRRAGFGVITRRLPGPNGAKPVWQYRVQGANAVRLAAILRPYLRVKHEQADVLAAFAFLTKGRSAPNRDAERAAQEAAYRATRRLNSGDDPTRHQERLASRIRSTSSAGTGSPSPTPTTP